MTAQLPLAPDADPSAIHAWLRHAFGLSAAEAAEELYGSYVAVGPVGGVVDLSGFETTEKEEAS